LQLTKIWEKVLARSPIGVRESFFDLGGHSLLAVRLFAQIEQLTGKRLPLATLFQAPTIEQLAAVLRDSGWTPPWSCLVPVQPGGSKPPLFCVHGGAGHALDFYPLSRRLGPDQPVYGLESPALDGKPGHDLTVEQMASLYLDEIQKLQPQGPYLIAGYCFGGNIAYEIAQQLKQRGQRAALLAIFHSSGQDYPKRIANIPWHKRIGYKLIDRLDLEFSNLADHTSKDRLLHILVRVRRIFDVFKIKWERRQDRKLGINRKHSFDYIIEEVKEVNARAARKYVRKPYDGPVLLFAASKQGRLTVYDPTLGWGPLLKGPAEIHKVEGHHEAIIREPRVRQLAEKLVPAMAEAMRAAQQP
jgi:thioesterase domain-containing protein